MVAVFFFFPIGRLICVLAHFLFELSNGFEINNFETILWNPRLFAYVLIAFWVFLMRASIILLDFVGITKISVLF